MERTIETTTENPSTPLPVSPLPREHKQTLGHHQVVSDQISLSNPSTQLQTWGNSSTSLQALIVQPPSLLARWFLLGSFFLFSIFLIWLWNLKIEQVSDAKVKVIQPQQVASIFPYTRSQTGDKYGLILDGKPLQAKFEHESELRQLLGQLSILLESLTSIHLHTTFSTALFRTIPMLGQEPLLSSVLSQYQNQSDRIHNKDLVLITQLPISATHLFKTGETIHISLETSKMSLLIPGEIIAITNDELPSRTSTVGNFYTNSINPYTINSVQMKVIPNSADITHQPIGITQLTPARIIQQKRVVDVLWDSLHHSQNQIN